MNRIDVSLVLPCFNEETIFRESVLQIIQTLKQSKFSFEIIFVDDKSTDRTHQLIEKICKKYSFSRAIFHQKNFGRGRAVRDGIEGLGGIEGARGKVVGYIDIDLEVSPIYMSQMVSLILEKKADVVIGKRIYRTSFHSIPREVLSRGYQWLAGWAVGTAGLDTETGYKFFNRRKILPLFRRAKHPRWFWDTEIMVWAMRKGLKIVEVPVLFLRRTDKQSSVRVIGDTMDYLINLWRLRGKLKPWVARHPHDQGMT